jgi:hypothetical protein
MALKSLAQKITTVNHYTDEQYDFISQLTGDISYCKTDLIFAGIRHAMLTRKRIIENVMIGDYELLYSNDYENQSLKRISGKPKLDWEPLYVYWIEQVTKKRIQIYFKRNNDDEDFNIETRRYNYKYVNKNVWDKFPVDIMQTLFPLG